MATYSDDFNRADSGANAGLGANWTCYAGGSVSNTGFQILSNQAVVTASFTDRKAKWNGGAVANDQFSQITVAAVNATDYGQSVIARFVDGDNFYEFVALNSSLVRLRKWVSASSTTLDTQTLTIANGDVMRIEVSGSSITCKVNGTTVIGPITDATFSSGGIGFESTNTATFDNWSGGDLTSGTGTANPTTGSVTINGRQPTGNAFTNVRIREVLINEAGSPVANQTGIHLIVWYSGFPGGAADLSYSNMTTDPNGTTSWSLATGTLLYNQRIFYVAHDGHSSLSVYTCAQIQPTYS